MQIKKNPRKNLNKNRILYFQIGLCVVLVVLLISIEWKSYAKPIDQEQVRYKEIVFEELVEIKLPEKKPMAKTTSEPKDKTEPQEPNENDKPIEEDPVIEQKTVKLNPNEVLKKLTPPIDKPIEDIPWINIQDVPIYPGCEIYTDNTKRRSCMQKKLSQFIGRHFDTQLATDLGLEGKHVIYTKFKISHTGEVIFMGARNPNPKLVKEAERVIMKLPKMIPGKQRDVPVNVIFGLPINFEINP